MDLVILRDLRIQTIVGIWDWERKMPQTVSIDLDMAADVGRAAETDDIEDALDYKKVAKRVTGFVQDARFQLVERMAEEVARLIMSEFDVPWVRVAVHKLRAVRDSANVGVVVERGQRG